MLPEKFKKYFWETDFQKLNVKDYPVYIIERILEYGDMDAVIWMMKNFKKPQIKQVLTEKRGISRKSANYWSSILDVPKNKILCLKMSYQDKQKSPWPY